MQRSTSRGTIGLAPPHSWGIPTAIPVTSPPPPPLLFLPLPPVPCMFALFCPLGDLLTSHIRNGPFPFSPSPSLSPSQASTPDSHQPSPEPAYTPKRNCHKAVPVKMNVMGESKWCCNECNRPFRGKWECKRHIESFGKRALCLACGSKFIERKDSRKRHFRMYCKGDVANLRFEDAFVAM